MEYCSRDVKFRELVIAFVYGMAGQTEKTSTGVLEDLPRLKPVQTIGEFCKGADIVECRGYFGEGLPQVCATCPN